MCVLTVKVLTNNAMHFGIGCYEDLLIPVTNFQNEDKGFMVLSGDVFDVPIRKDIVHRVVRWQLAKRQQVWLSRNMGLKYPMPVLITVRERNKERT